MAKKSKWYVVWVGRTPGVFNNWNDCKRSTEGFPEAKFKSFESNSEAYAAFSDHPAKHVYRKANSSATPTKTANRVGLGQPIADSISVDAACSGNPGKMEYQGVDTVTKEEIFHMGPYADGTNNIGEFLALVHALALLQKKNLPTKTIYSDSKIAIGWVKKKKCNTKLEHTGKNDILFELIDRAEKWLENNSYYNPILKWETKVWGEVPADFGRK
jgi:ribonuclease HI